MCQGQKNKKIILETKKKELNNKLQSLSLQTKSSNEGQMKLEEYAESVKQQLLQRKRRWAEEKVREEEERKRQKEKQQEEQKRSKKKRKTKNRD